MPDDDDRGHGFGRPGPFLTDYFTRKNVERARLMCPECKKEGKKSLVFAGATTGTMLYCPTFFDESGHRHKHDSNSITTSYSCSQGHKWNTSIHPGTCHCGWKAEKEEKMPGPEKPKYSESQLKDMTNLADLARKNPMDLVSGPSPTILNHKEEIIPDHVIRFPVRSYVDIKGITFQVAYTNNETLVLEPVGTMVIGNDEKEKK